MNSQNESLFRKRQIDNLEEKALTDQYLLGWNEGLEKAAVEIEKMHGFGKDTLSSFAIYIRRLKK